MKKLFFLISLFCCPLFLFSSAKAETASVSQQFQLGYVYDSWNSNFIYHGVESRFPLSYRLTAANLSLQLSTAFVSGDYKSDILSDGTDEGGFAGQSLSDTLLRASLSYPMGGDLGSTFSGSLNIPTGNTQWEGAASQNAVPYIFDPSYYHGRGFGFDLFYMLTSNGQGAQWGAGLGFMRATTAYGSGSSSLTPWGAVMGMACLGLSSGKDEQFNLRIDHSVPFSTVAEGANYPFTLGQSTQFSGQWIKKLGGDRFQLTASYGLFDQSQFPDLTSGSYVQDSQTYLGNRAQVRSFLAWVFSPGVSMETGLNWLHVFANGIDPHPSVSNFGNSGGDLYGAMQSMTFQIDPGTYLNIAGEYDYIYTLDSAKANFTGTILTNVGYNKFLLGTNVGFKW